jgi:orotate phosphoribosyltransferase/AMMECR1 domain-containing protein
MSEASRERERLLALLRRDGILRSTPDAPITHRTGEIAPWAFYSWGLSLSQEGLRLAARELLRTLEGFGSTQIASYGYTGLPLLAACVLEGGGRYTGLSIRETRKPYLTNRRIDGAVDASRPVVVIDDSLSSGTSLHQAIVALEDEGLEVEGTAALVHFPFRGAKAWANAAGYRTATAFDIWRDLGMADPPIGYAGPEAGRPPVGGDPLPEGLAPAVLARLAARAFLLTGQTPRWPARLDGAYDARGGSFVSFRRRADDHRLVRDGFWHFDPADADPARDLVLATVDTLWRNPGAVSLESLDALKIAVTFFGPLEHVSPAGLDFDRYGIVARSELWPDKIGGALPNTQVFISDIEQYRHARVTNARIDEGEPHALYRHTLSKHPEPGETWLPYGQVEGAQTGWWRDPAIGRRLAARARQRLADPTCGPPLEPGLLPCPIEGVAVALYAGGLRGYGLAHGPDLEQALAEAVEAARRDPRYAAGDPADVDLTVSVLHHGEDHGSSRMLAEKKLRRGLDALTRYGSGQPVTVLPAALVLNAWTPAQLFDAAEALAGATGPAANWRTAQVAGWLSPHLQSPHLASGADAMRPLRFGFPARESMPLDDAGADEQTNLLASYIRRAQDPDGLPAYRLAANQPGFQRAGTAGRVIHGLYSLFIAGRAAARTDWTDAARAGIATALATVGYGGVALPDHLGGPLADAVLLAAAAEAGLATSGAAVLLAGRVAGFIHPSGWIGAGPKRLDNPQDQEFLPGAAVWALCAWSRATGAPLPPNLAAARRHYGGRFDDCPGWGSPWLAQGWGALHQLSADPKDAALVFRVADWLCERQLNANGAFLEELSLNEPSFNTGFVAEGIAAAWRTALACRDTKRCARYETSWRRALGFVRTLTLQPGDGFAFPSPELAVGGVRCTLSRGDIRIDQVSHSLHALVDGRACVVDAARPRVKAQSAANQ